MPYEARKVAFHTLSSALASALAKGDVAVLALLPHFRTEEKMMNI